MDRFTTPAMGVSFHKARRPAKGGCETSGRERTKDMTSSQYDNVIKWTMAREGHAEGSPEGARAVLRNLGVPFPGGSLEDAAAGR